MSTFVCIADEVARLIFEGFPIDDWISYSSCAVNHGLVVEGSKADLGFRFF